MKILPHVLIILAIGTCFAIPPSIVATASDETPTAAVTTSSQDRSVSGQFKSSDGDAGTFIETYTVADPVTTDTIIYTMTDSTTTRTETLTTTANSDGTKTVTVNELGFGDTTAFTSTTTFAASKGGSAVGTGIYTAADGTTGVLAVVIARNGQTSITSTDFTSATGILTREIRLEEKGQGDTVKTLNVDASGALTVTTITRFGGMHHQHP